MKPRSQMTTGEIHWEKKRARALQEDTGWSYQQCLHIVRAKTEDEIDEMLEEQSSK